MLCPKCKTEIKEGYLYCQKCGEEIIMVPDYEVEIEDGIEKAISEVAENIAVDLVNQSDADTESEIVAEKSGASTESDSKKTIKNRKKIGPRIIVALVLILGSIVGVFTYKAVIEFNDYFSYDIQYAKAESLYNSGDYEECIKTLKHVISIDGASENPRLMLADSYYRINKYDESIAVLNQLLNDFPNDIELYERLIANYEKEGDINSIIQLSKSSENETISNLFNDYVCSVPEFSIEEGNYYEPQTVRLMADGNGAIYYTLDGSIPDTNSMIYKTPIKLEQGETVINAIHINDKGISSNSISKSYNIEILLPKSPSLLTQSGDYTSPRLIKVSESNEGTIYYTTDGSEPTIESKEYEPPIAMPLGKSEYKFAVINDSGVSSEVVTAEYNLTISGAIDTSTAVAAVQFYVMAKGQNVLGYEYVAKYGYSLGSRNYYFVEEYEIVDGKKRRTNTTYAVDTQTTELFTVTRNTKTGDFDFGSCI